MGRLKQAWCAKCKTNPKPAGQGYCLSCRKAYHKAYNALYQERTKRKSKPLVDSLESDWDLEPWGRTKLGLTDNDRPSDDDLIPWQGYHIDRWVTRSYGQRGWDASNDWTPYYKVGHMAIKRFWHTIGGNAWEMGPDMVDFVDGQGLKTALKRTSKRVQPRGTRAVRR